MAARLKSMGKAIEQQVMSADGYTTLQGEDELRYKIIPHINTVIVGKEKHELAENIVITYSAKRARKDLHDRERLVEKARKLLDKPSQIQANQKRGGRKYITGEKDKNQSCLCSPIQPSMSIAFGHEWRDIRPPVAPQALNGRQAASKSAKGRHLKN